jgi:hypothetical protein
MIRENKINEMTIRTNMMIFSGKLTANVEP